MMANHLRLGAVMRPFAPAVTRQLIELTIPLGILVAIVPAAVKVLRLPISVELTLGDIVGRIWAFTVGFAMLSICLGVLLRVRHPSLSFVLEWPALIYAGMISSIFGASILIAAGLRGWAAAWWVFATGAYFLFRFLELSSARKLAAQAHT